MNICLKILVIFCLSGSIYSKRDLSSLTEIQTINEFFRLKLKEISTEKDSCFQRIILMKDSLLNKTLTVNGFNFFLFYFFFN